MVGKAIGRAESRVLQRAVGQRHTRRQAAPDSSSCGHVKRPQSARYRFAPEAPPAAGSTWRWMSRLARLLSGRLCTTWGQEQGLNGQVSKEKKQEGIGTDLSPENAGLRAAPGGGALRRSPATALNDSPVCTWCRVWRQRSSSAFSCCSQLREIAAT
jgi:hypothetical protein